MKFPSWSSWWTHKWFERKHRTTPARTWPGRFAWFAAYLGTYKQVSQRRNGKTLWKTHWKTRDKCGKTWTNYKQLGNQEPDYIVSISKGLDMFWIVLILFVECETIHSCGSWSHFSPEVWGSRRILIAMLHFKTTPHFPKLFFTPWIAEPATPITHGYHPSWWGPHSKVSHHPRKKTWFHDAKSPHTLACDNWIWLVNTKLLAAKHAPESTEVQLNHMGGAIACYRSKISCHTPLPWLLIQSHEWYPTNCGGHAIYWNHPT